MVSAQKQHFGAFFVQFLGDFPQIRNSGVGPGSGILHLPPFLFFRFSMLGFHEPGRDWIPKAKLGFCKLWKFDGLQGDSKWIQQRRGLIAVAWAFAALGYGHALSSKPGKNVYTTTVAPPLSRSVTWWPLFACLE